MSPRRSSTLRRRARRDISGASRVHGTKLVATIGPRTNSAEAMRALVEAGMDVARLNGSHADLAWHARAIALLRRVAPQVPIVFDLRDSKIRTKPRVHEPTFKAGDPVTFTTDEGPAGDGKVAVTDPAFHQEVTAGDLLVADDGALRFQVVRVRRRDVLCLADREGTLRSGVGIHVRGAPSREAPHRGADAGMVSFAKAQCVDFVGLSFVECAEHVNAVRGLIDDRSPRIIAKIENQKAVTHLEEIVEAADGLMIDRGDLAVATSVEGIALLQKRILREALLAAKPAIVATEMLHSMMHGPVPTKAEVADISNAVLDGAAALMLSGETAIGDFPVEAVTVMRRIIDTVDRSQEDTPAADESTSARHVPQAMADAIAMICRELPVTKVVAVTASGYAARMVATRRPRQPILVVSNDPATARSSQLLPGTEGVLVDLPFSHTSTDHIPQCLEALWRRGKLHEEDIVLVTHVGYPKLGSRMNVIQTHAVGDLRESLSWGPRRRGRRQPVVSSSNA